MIIDGTKDPEADGAWSDVQPWSIIPLHSIVLPDGKMLSFGTTEQGMQGGQFVYDLWDPVTNVHSVLPNTTAVNIFCSNMAIDPTTGNVIIMGGDGYLTGGDFNAGVADVVVFDYKTREIRDAQQGDLNFARWYGSALTLPNGELLMLGGRDADKLGSSVPEIFNTETGFRKLPGADMPDLVGGPNVPGENWWYPHMWVDSAGDVIVVEADGNDIYRLKTDGDGSVEKLGKTGFNSGALNSSIMFAKDKVAIIGDDAGLWVGDMSLDVPTFTRVAQVESARVDAGMSILPDGRIVITGGSGTLGGNDINTAVYSATVWDPETNTVTPMADQALARLYHSSALILPDGTVFSGGGGAPGPLINTNAEIFMPDYLFGPDGELADRPEIFDAPKNVDNGETFRMTVDDAAAITAVSMTKSGAMTHARNSDARFFKLDFSVVDGATIEVKTLGPNVMTPGLWMLTTIDTNGVPSVASLVGVDMGPLVDTGPLIPSTEAYKNIEQIDGAFSLSVEARFDDLAGGSYQKVFDFGNGEFADNIWLGQVGRTNAMAFEIVTGAGASRIVAENAIVEGEVASWSVRVDATGFMALFKNAEIVAEGQGVVPADVERKLNFFGDSIGRQDSRLDGMVRNLTITNGEGEMPDPVEVIDAPGGYVSGTDGNDLFEGSDGDDTFYGRAGNDEYLGGDGYNQVDYDGRAADYDFVRAADGSVTVTGSNGKTDRLVDIDGFWFYDEARWYPIDELAPKDTTPGPEYPGTGGGDGGGSVNVITSRGGYVLGTNGNDRFEGGGRDDTFYGQGGNDEYLGGEGYNQVDYDGRASDYSFVRADDGSVMVTGATGKTDRLVDIDGLWFYGENEWVALEALLSETPDPDGPGGGEAGQTIVVNGGYAIGTDGNDRFEGSGRDETFYGQDGNDEYLGGEGYNQVDYDGRASDYAFALNADGTVTVTRADGKTDTLIDIDGFWFYGESKWYPMDALVRPVDDQDAMSASVAASAEPLLDPDEAAMACLPDDLSGADIASIDGVGSDDILNHDQGEALVA